MIGAVLPLTGGDAALGETARNGIEVAVARTNDAGGVRGIKVELRVFDSGSTLEGATYATNVALQNEVAVILGEVSSARTEAVAIAARPARTPVFSPNASDERVLGLGGVHSMARRGRHIGRITGRFLVSQGWLDIAGMADEKRQLSSATYQVKSAGGRLLAETQCDGRGRYQNVLAVIQPLNPQAMVVVCDPREAATILADAQAVGLTVPFVAGPPWDHSSVIDDPVSNGVYVVTYFHRDDPVAADFVAAYQRVHDAEPSGLAALAHDAAAVAIDAIDRTRSLDPHTIGVELEKNSDVALATGVPAWARSKKPSMAVVQISGGTTVFIARVEIR